jgi:curli biogenesis system outer membrane secretion channel CsgG
MQRLFRAFALMAICSTAAGTAQSMWMRAASAQQQAQPRIAIYGFSSQGLSPWWGGAGGFDPGDALSDIMTDKLVNAGTYNVIDRTHIEQVLAEQNLSRSGDVSPSSEAQLGRMLGANYLIFGRIIQFDKTGGQSGGLGGIAGGLLGGAGINSQKVTLHVSMRIVEANTGRIAATMEDTESKSGTSFSLAGAGSTGGLNYSSSDFTNSTVGQLITTVADNLVAKMDPTKLVAAPAGPTISAKVLGVEGNSIVINAGTNKNVTVGTYFTIYETRFFKDPDSGKLLQSHSKKGTIQITSVDAETSTGKLVDGTVKPAEVVISGE